jgi:putative DNA primase/helicase
MPAKLRVESAAVMRWLIEGHEKWIEDGTLHRCAAVKEATDSYFESQATLDMWITERCSIVPDDGRSGRDWPKAGELYADFSGWKKDRGECPFSSTRWGEQMQIRFRKVQAAGARYVGVLLQSTWSRL